MAVGLIIGAALAASINERIVTASDPAVPVRLSTNECVAKTFVFIGNKSARVANTGTVWIQTSSTNDAPGIKLLSGQTISLTGGTGSLTGRGADGTGGLDLRQFWVDVEMANDGVVVLVLQ